MKLKYRGTAYVAPSLGLVLQEKQHIGCYRGQDCYRGIYDTKLLNQTRSHLTYRGVAYRVGAMQAAPMEPVQSTFKIQVPQNQKPIRSSRHQQLSELDRVHNKFLLEKLEQRLSAALKKGDRDLVQLLESEKNQLQ